MSFFNKLFKTTRETPQQTEPLPPEEYWEVQITNGILTVIDPDLRMLNIKLADILTISIYTTDQGPWLPDAWLAFTGNSFGYVAFPVGCKGYDDTYNVISKFKGFDFKQVISAMSSVTNAEFLLWTKVAKI